MIGSFVRAVLRHVYTFSSHGVTWVTAGTEKNKHRKRPLKKSKCSSCERDEEKAISGERQNRLIRPAEVVFIYSPEFNSVRLSDRCLQASAKSHPINR